MYIPGLQEQDLDSSAMSTFFFHGLKPAASKLFEPYRELLMSLPWDPIEYPYRTWREPGLLQSPGWITNSLQGAAVSVAFNTFQAYVDNADLISSAMSANPNGPVKTIAQLHEECTRLEMIDSWSKVGEHLPGDGTHSYRSLIDRCLDRDVRNLLRQTDYFSGQYDPLFERVSTTRPWKEYYAGVERVLMMYQTSSQSSKVRFEAPSASHRPRSLAVGVHMLDNPSVENEHVCSFEDIKKILDEHSNRLETLQLQQAQVLHAATVPKVIHTPTSSGPLRAFGNAGTPAGPRPDGPQSSILPSTSQRDDRGEHREGSATHPRDPPLASPTQSPNGRPMARDRDRDRRSPTPSGIAPRRSNRTPVPNRDFIAFLQQTAQQDDIWNDQVGDLVAIATAHLESSTMLQDSSSDSDC